MWTFIISFILFCLAVAAMAIGVMLKGKHIKGSCGGIARILGIENNCGGCSKPCDKHAD